MVQQNAAEVNLTALRMAGLFAPEERGYSAAYKTHNEAAISGQPRLRIGTGYSSSSETRIARQGAPSAPEIFSGAAKSVYRPSGTLRSSRFSSTATP